MLGLYIVGAKSPFDEQVAASLADCAIWGGARDQAEICACRARGERCSGTFEGRSTYASRSDLCRVLQHGWRSGC